LAGPGPALPWQRGFVSANRPKQYSPQWDVKGERSKILEWRIGAGGSFRLTGWKVRLMVVERGGEGGKMDRVCGGAERG
jgi:hypothetical protein